MKVQEIIFQGLYGLQSAVRFELQPDITKVDVPSYLTVSDVHAVLTSLLSPERLTVEERRQFEGNDEVKIMATLVHQERRFRLLRRGEPDSMRLQIEEGGSFRELQRGQEQVIGFLREKLNLQDFSALWSLSYWKFDEAPPPRLTESEVRRQDPRIKEVVEQYRLAVKFEMLEDDLRVLTDRVESARKALGEGARLEEKLRKGRKRYEEIYVEELAEEDLRVLDEKDERMREYTLQLGRLSAEEEEARLMVQKLTPQKPWKGWQFWVGISISVLSILLSVIFAEDLRPIALGDIVGFGICAWVLLRFLNDLERANVHSARLESIKRRINQVREEQISFRERVNHLMIHAGVGSEEELTERIEKANRLKAILEKLEEELEGLQRNPQYRRHKEEFEELSDELDALRAQREEMPETIMSSFQLASDLREMGLFPEELLDASEDEESEESEEEEVDEEDRGPLQRLYDVGQRTGVIEEGQLSSTAQAMWSKICGHVLSPRFQKIKLEAPGELRLEFLTPDQVEMWMRTRGGEVSLISCALALAMQVNLSPRHHAFGSVWIMDPGEELTGAQAEKFEEVLRSASAKTQVVLLKPSS